MLDAIGPRGMARAPGIPAGSEVVTRRTDRSCEADSATRAVPSTSSRSGLSNDSGQQCVSPMCPGWPRRERDHRHEPAAATSHSP